MCGITGIYSFDPNRSVDPRLLDDMLHIIRHRGPDDQGVFFDGPLAMGMRRLSIIDLAGGQQPVFNETGDVAVVFNGEIYNYRELMVLLQQRGHVFRSVSDTEAIVHAYEEWGDECLQRLRGMFAFAIWDARRRRLLVARDRLGIKPLYYTEAGGDLVFGSEIKSILLHPAVEPRLDMQALGYFLRLKYVPAPWTMFQNIRSLMPGHLLVCDGQGVQVRQYWDLSFQTKDDRCSDQEYAEQLEALLRESVRLHLRSDVPFGAFLSGGLDSSTVVALMSQMLDEPVKTFSVGFAGVEGDELPYARAVARQFATDHHEILARPADFVDLAEQVVWHLDQPIADQALMATYLVSKLARRHVKMVLTGEGGDELFAGYARYSGERFAPLVGWMPSQARTAARAVGMQLPGLRRAKIALFALSQRDEVSRLANWFPLFNRETAAAVHSAALRQILDGEATEQLIGQYLGATDARGSVNRMLFVDTKLWLPDYLLLRGDKLTMAASIEARVPLLDHKLVEFAASLPPHLKIRGMTRKYLLKRVSRSWLGPEIVHRKKQGFPIPIATWFRTELRSLVRDMLAPDTVRRRGLFDPNFVQRLIAEHEAGLADHAILLWGLMSVEIWHRVFIERSASSVSDAALPTSRMAAATGAL